MLLILRTAACSLVLVASLGVNLPAQDTPQATTPVTDNLDRQFDEGSKIGKISLDEQTIEAIDLLGRVWGFVKYHHPAVARGEYNWDYELFRVMPMYLAADSKRERSAVLVKWIEGLGTFKGRPEDSTKSDLEYVLRPDVQWIDGLESKELTELLTALQRAERPEENRYVELNTRAGNPKLNEESYQQFDYPDTGFRILALYRYWNIVQYYFPYRHLTDKDWNDVLAEFIPKFVNAEDATEYRLATMELIAAVQDTHAQLLGADQFSMRIRGVNQGNLVLRFIEGKLMVVGHLDAKLAEESEARIGDIVTAVGGVSVENWIEQKARYWAPQMMPHHVK